MALSLNNSGVNSLNNVITVMGIKNYKQPSYFMNEAQCLINQYDKMRLERACRFASVVSMDLFSPYSTAETVIDAMYLYHHPHLEAAIEADDDFAYLNDFLVALRNRFTC